MAKNSLEDKVNSLSNQYKARSVSKVQVKWKEAKRIRNDFENASRS
jgi:hypothetical protein